MRSGKTAPHLLLQTRAIGYLLAMTNLLMYSMKWSWKIGQFAGIGVYMHATFLLLVGWVALSGWLQGQTLGAAASAVAFVLALFL